MDCLIPTPEKQRLLQTHDAAGQFFNFYGIWRRYRLATITSGCEYRKRLYIIIMPESCMRKKEAETMSKKDDKAFDAKVALGDGSGLFLSSFCLNDWVHRLHPCTIIEELALSCHEFKI